MVRFALVPFALLLAGCAAQAPRTVSLECDQFEPASGYVLITGVSSERAEVLDVIGYFVVEQTRCGDGRVGIAPGHPAYAEIRGPSRRRPLAVARTGFFVARSVTRADTLLLGLTSEDRYALTVGEALEAYARDAAARRRAYDAAAR